MRILKADGSVEDVDLHGRPVTLEELQAAVGGYITPIPGTQSRAYVNEEGLLIGLPPNELASLKYGFGIVGNVAELDPWDRQE